jgi:hypothetical protein
MAASCLPECVALCIVDLCGSISACCGAAAASIDAAQIHCGCAGAAPDSVPAPTARTAVTVQLFAVTAAPTEYERRAVAWLYHYNSAPDLADWRDCIARFGLDGAPAHTLTGADRAVHVALDIDAGIVTVTPVGASNAAGERRRATAGALAPRRLLAAPRTQAARAAPTQVARAPPTQVPAEPGAPPTQAPAKSDYYIKMPDSP